MDSTQKLAEEIRAFTWHLTRKMAQESTHIGKFTPSQEAVAVRIHQQPGRTGAEISRQLFLTPQSINVTVMTMIDEGIVEVRKSARDGRRRELYLTASGNAEVEKIRAYKTLWLCEELDEKLTDEEREQALAALASLKKVLPEL